jgi:hypothetical protein
MTWDDHPEEALAQQRGAKPRRRDARARRLAAREEASSTTPTPTAATLLAARRFLARCALRGQDPGAVLSAEAVAPGTGFRLLEPPPPPVDAVTHGGARARRHLGGPGPAAGNISRRPGSPGREGDGGGATA